MKPDTGPGTYLALDGMRGAGAMLVVIAHSYIFWAGLSLPNGFPVVDMFFLFSGFVIAFAYEPRFHAGMGAGKFMQQRLVRLYPLYLLGLEMGAVVQALIVADQGPDAAGAFAGQFIPQVFMLPSPDFAGHGDFYQFNVPAWTLFFELCANLVYVLAWRWLKSTRVLAIVVGVAAVWLAASVLAAGKVDIGPTWNDFWGGFPRVAFSFFGGVLLFRLRGSPSTIKARVSLWAVAPALVLPFIVLVPASRDVRPWLDIFMVIVVSPLLIGWATMLNPPRWLWKTFATMGAMSYAMYILHYPVFVAVKRLSYKFPELSGAWAPWSGLAILILSFAIAVTAARFYDEPVRAWISARLKAHSRNKEARLTAATVAE